MSQRNQGHWGCSQSLRPSPSMGTFPKPGAGKHRRLWMLGLGWSKQAVSLHGHKALTVQGQPLQGGASIFMSVPQRAGPSPHTIFLAGTAFASTSATLAPMEGGAGVPRATDCGDCFCSREHEQNGACCSWAGAGAAAVWVYLAHGSHDTLGNKHSHFLSRRLLWINKQGCRGASLEKQR